MSTVQLENYQDETTIVVSLDSASIADLLTFKNSNEVVYALVHSNREAALAYYNELAYWADNNQI